MSAEVVQHQLLRSSGLLGFQLTQATVPNVPVSANASENEFDELDMVPVR